MKQETGGEAHITSEGDSSDHIQMFAVETSIPAPVTLGSLKSQQRNRQV